MKKIFLSLFLVPFVVSAQTYELKKSDVTYHIKYLVKKFDGSSKVGKGLGKCEKENCEFLVAIRIDSFSSDNSNRDLHFLETMKAATYPMIVGRLNIAAGDVKKGSFPAVIEYEMSGVKNKVKIDKVNATQNAANLVVSFDQIIKLSDFKIEKPSLLGVAIDDEVPVKTVLEFVQK